MIRSRGRQSRWIQPGHADVGASEACLNRSQFLLAQKQQCLWPHLVDIIGAAHLVHPL